MHDSVMAFGRRVLTPERVAGKRVVELGSYDHNGSLRSVVEPLGPASYVGIDQERGPGVDVVLDAALALALLGEGWADLVVCTEVLEHAPDWRSVVAAMKAVAGRGGLLLVTTRSPGFPRHDFPGDEWRFDLDDFRAAFADCEELALEPDSQPGHPGVLALYRSCGARGAFVDLSGIQVARAPGTG